jgi:hypothetical protein
MQAQEQSRRDARRHPNIQRRVSTSRASSDPLSKAELPAGRLYTTNQPCLSLRLPLLPHTTPSPSRVNPTLAELDFSCQEAEFITHRHHQRCHDSATATRLHSATPRSLLPSILHRIERCDIPRSARSQSALLADSFPQQCS